MNTIYLIDGKPHRLCDCPKLEGKCRLGAERTLQTTQLSQCFVPAPDVLLALPEALPPEATHDMQEAMVRALFDMDHSDLKWKDAMKMARKAYRAALDAAPKTPAEARSVNAQGTRALHAGRFACKALIMLFDARLPDDVAEVRDSNGKCLVRITGIHG